MRHSFLEPMLLAFLCLFHSSAAQGPYFTMGNVPNLVVGQQYTLTWTNSTGPVDLTLQLNITAQLTTGIVFAQSISGTSYTWNITDKQVQDAGGTGPDFVYNFQVEDDNNLNDGYSNAFLVVPAGSNPSTFTIPATSTTDSPGATRTKSPVSSTTDTNKASGTTADATSTGASKTSSSSSDSAAPAGETGSSAGSGSTKPSSSSISTGAKVGIAVGIVALALIAIGLIAFYFYQRGKHSAYKKTEPAGTELPFEKAELGPGTPSATPLSAVSPASAYATTAMARPLTEEDREELERRRRAAQLEGRAVEMPPELSGDHDYYELEALRAK